MEQFGEFIVASSFAMGWVIYLMIFFVAVLETALGIGIIIPGSTILLLSGAAAAGGGVSLLGLIPAATLGAIFGDNVNYYLGERYGRTWVLKKRWILTPTHFATGKAFFDSHGAKSVFLGRFVSGIKEIVPFIAGMAQMEMKRFMFYNALGAFGWACAWIFAGYAFYHAVERVKFFASGVGIISFVLIILLVAYYISHTKKSS